MPEDEPTSSTAGVPPPSGANSPPPSGPSGPPPSGLYGPPTPPHPYGSSPTYGAAPTYGAPPHPGWPQNYGGGYPAPSHLSPADERLWGLCAHLSTFVLPIIGPLIVMLVQGEKSPFVRRHSVEALNFDLTLLIVVLVCIFSFFLVFPLFIAFGLAVAGFIFTILGAVAANNGQDYRYPINFRMVK